ncbi:hypothetical protein [Dysgonomonas sp. 521]|uniref:hypothetical protein n=1 Tax=Dysgonomonas sp. 521 TaxID=2302932 RepID=UPI0013D2F5C3|nr:hypothetical protein [Dysgonomonas sp. 521]
MNTLSYMIQLIVVIASILLGMLLYPILLKKWRRFVTWLYWSSTGEREEEPEKGVLTETEKPSVIGKSKFNLRQSTPNAATNQQTEKAIEKEFTFVPETGETPEMPDMDVPLEKVEFLPEEEFDAGQEEIGLETGNDAVQASGASYEELFKAHRVIEDRTATRGEEKDAGGVIYGQKGTNIFEQVAASGEETALRISGLIDIYLKELAGADTEGDSAANYSKQMEPQDFKEFDINSIF